MGALVELRIILERKLYKKSQNILDHLDLNVILLSFD
jgi:hypothetical protein